MTSSGVSPSFKLRAFLAALSVCLLCGAFASAAQALPVGFWGVVPQAAPNAEQLQRLARGGVESERIPVAWAVVQSAPGAAFNWAPVDQEVELAAKEGVEVLPFMAGVPAWAIPYVFVPGAGHSVKAPPHLPVSGPARSGWAAFLTSAVARYGPTGSFWSEHPTVPKVPIRNWQIWNEANFKYFVAKPNPAEFGKLVKISSQAIKAADPGAKVILGGLFAEPKEAQENFKPPRAYFASDFLQQMYEKTPGIKSSFDGVALHPYTGSYKHLTPEIEGVRTVLRENHDLGKGLWITELGWSSEPPTPGNAFAKGLAGQAQQLTGAFNLLKAKAVSWRIKHVYWFSVDDEPATCNFCDGSGLFAKGFIPKKSWFAYVKFTGGTP